MLTIDRKVLAKKKDNSSYAYEMKDNWDPDFPMHYWWYSMDGASDEQLKAKHLLQEMFFLRVNV